LTAQERQFFENENPYGFILFRRNIDNPSQVRALVAELRDAMGRPDAPVLIDQEGGRVARLGPPHWPKLPPARTIGILAETDLEAGLAAALASGRVIGAMLADLNIDVACAPVADLLLPETHDVIGDRAFAADPLLVAALARAMAQGLADAGVTAIVKHIPGHGRAQADSHLSLPRIATPRAELAETDFAAFRALDDLPWAMVAHCIYADIDPNLPASISPRLIAQTIREEIGFKGILIADDIGMKALQGTLAANAAATLAAGCDLTLHCSGDLAEMKEIAPAVAPLSGDTLRRLQNASAPPKTEFDISVELARLDALMSA
jgi:beta-N-acetylhexosaminidase